MQVQFFIKGLTMRILLAFGYTRFYPGFTIVGLILHNNTIVVKFIAKYRKYLPKVTNYQSTTNIEPPKAEIL